jgi:outer membrane lipoprotein-sorting protein
MEAAKQVPVIAIVYQRSVGGPSAAIQVKVEQSRDGKSRVTILQPLSMEGVVSVDDGRSSQTYLPDRQHLIWQESPRTKGWDLDQRLALAEQNYRFKLEGTVNIAGRKAAQIVATPAKGQMPTRRYYIDRENGFLLRMETLDSGAQTLQLDTKFVKFPKDLPKENFTFNFVGKEPRTFKCPVPERITTPATVKPDLGFAPVVPGKLPLGFMVQEPQLAGADGFKFAAIRLSDGLVNATVYQWAGREANLPKAFQEQKGDRTVKGVRFRIVGDLPDGARDLLMELFIKEALKGLKVTVEPEITRSALNHSGGVFSGMLMYCIQKSVVEAQTSLTGMCAFSRTAGSF